MANGYSHNEELSDSRSKIMSWNLLVHDEPFEQVDIVATEVALSFLKS